MKRNVIIGTVLTMCMTLNMFGSIEVKAAQYEALAPYSDVSYDYSFNIKEKDYITEIPLTVYYGGIAYTNDGKPLQSIPTNVVTSVYEDEWDEDYAKHIVAVKGYANSYETTDGPSSDDRTNSWGTNFFKHVSFKDVAPSETYTPYVNLVPSNGVSGVPIITPIDSSVKIVENKLNWSVSGYFEDAMELSGYYKVLVKVKLNFTECKRIGDIDSEGNCDIEGTLVRSDINDQLKYQDSFYMKHSYNFLGSNFSVSHRDYVQLVLSVINSTGSSTKLSRQLYTSSFDTTINRTLTLENGKATKIHDDITVYVSMASTYNKSDFTIVPPNHYERGTITYKKETFSGNNNLIGLEQDACSYCEQLGDFPDLSKAVKIIPESVYGHGIAITELTHHEENETEDNRLAAVVPTNQAQFKIYAGRDRVKGIVQGAPRLTKEKLIDDEPVESFKLRTGNANYLDVSSVESLTDKKRAYAVADNSSYKYGWLDYNLPYVNTSDSELNTLARQFYRQTTAGEWSRIYAQKYIDFLNDKVKDYPNEQFTDVNKYVADSEYICNLIESVEDITEEDIKDMDGSSQAVIRALKELKTLMSDPTSPLYLKSGTVFFLDLDLPAEDTPYIELDAGYDYNNLNYGGYIPTN